MVRILALFGLATGFLIISPKLRDGVLDTFASGVQGVQHYSPYSYVVLAMVAVGSFMVSLKRGSQPR